MAGNNVEKTTHRVLIVIMTFVIGIWLTQLAGMAMGGGRRRTRQSAPCGGMCPCCPVASESESDSDSDDEELKVASEKARKAQTAAQQVANLPGAGLAGDAGILENAANFVANVAAGANNAVAGAGAGAGSILSAAGQSVTNVTAGAAQGLNSISSAVGQTASEVGDAAGTALTTLAGILRNGTPEQRERAKKIIKRLRAQQK